MQPELRDPLVYSNWVWITGAILIVCALSWVLSLLIAYRVRPIEVPDRVTTLGQLQKERYTRQIHEIEGRFASGELTAKETHFALAALIRAAASEKTGVNVEALTTDEAAARFPTWPALARALAWCEDETFPPQEASQLVYHGVNLAYEVVNG